jgi:hypothetical protein
MKVDDVIKELQNIQKQGYGQSEIKNENNSQIKPKELVNPTDLAKQIWQDVWSVSGATPENCLYTFVECRGVFCCVAVGTNHLILNVMTLC